jgi:Flp pilus assembly protein TadD
MYRISRSVFTAILLFVLAPVLAAETSAQAQNNSGVRQSRSPVSVLDSTREQDGLVGSVWRVKIESAKIDVQDGRPIEGPRQLLELTTYGIKGNRAENTTYPSGDSPIGKEEYKYDDRGNIIEMTLRDEHGAAVSREAYSYQFDTLGNWTKMVTSLVVFEDGRLKREPVEVTYRTVTYYFNDSLANIVDVSSTREMSKATEPTELQQARQEKAVVSSTTGNFKVPSTPSESTRAQPSLTTYPLQEAKASATGNRSNDETVAARGAGSSGVESVSSVTAPSASNTAGTGAPPLNVESVSSVTAPSAINTAGTGAPPLNVESVSSVTAPSAINTAGTGAPPLNVESVSSVTAPSAVNTAGTGAPALNKDVPTESPSRDQVSVSSTSRNSSAVEAARAEGSPVNFRPSDDVAAQKNARDYYKAGMARSGAGDVKGAVEAYLESIKIDPKSAEVFFSLGSAYLKLDKNNDAARAFKQAVQVEPDLAEAQYGLGLASFRLKRYSDAVAAFKKATNLSPKMAKAHFGLAAAYQELRQSDSVIEEYRILQRLDPDLAKRLAQTFPSSVCQLLPQCR